MEARVPGSGKIINIFPAVSIVSESILLKFLLSALGIFEDLVYWSHKFLPSKFENVFII